MKSRYVIGGMLVVVIILLVAAVFSFSDNRSGQYDTSSSAPTQAPIDANMNASSTVAGTSTAAQSYTVAQVAQHNSSTSCWSAINGRVYDLTAWINKHPGGPEHILSICGSDGSSAFNAQHGSQSRPEKILQTFYIGDLAS